MRREMSAMLSLAWPVVLTEVGWILMGVVDTVAVGPLGPAAIGAVGTGAGIYFALMVLGIGTLFALDTFVAQAAGAGLVDDSRRWFASGLWLAVALSVVLTGAGFLVLARLPSFGMTPDVVVLLEPYLADLLWSVAPLLVYTVFRRYLQAMQLVRPVMLAIIVANLVNAAANWLFIYGHWGAPALGVRGAALATLASRLFLMATLWWVVVRFERSRPGGTSVMSLAPDLGRIWRLFRHGLPAAGQIMLEVGVFSAASVLAARISPAAAGAHQVVLQIASFFFMVPLGLSSAAAVRVGLAVGRKDYHGARLAGWTAVLLALVSAGGIALLFAVAPGPLLRVFTDDAGVLSMAGALLLVCAFFQPFDGVQAVATGALRGQGDTTTPMLFNLAGHWFVGLPLGYLLCFAGGWGVYGLWVGLAAGLTLVGVGVLATWHRRNLLPRPAIQDVTG